MEILKSASRIVFLMLALTACTVFSYSVVTGKTMMETKDFMVLASAAFAYYFTKKSNAEEKK
jgi:hypothetical protein